MRNYKEILFRAKRVDNNEWAFGDLLHLPNGDVVILSNKGYVKVIPETVGQFIGLVDKNGEKIFENDIIIYTWNTLNRHKNSFPLNAGGNVFDYVKFVDFLLKVAYNNVAIN